MAPEGINLFPFNDMFSSLKTCVFVLLLTFVCTNTFSFIEPAILTLWPKFTICVRPDTDSFTWFFFYHRNYVYAFDCVAYMTWYVHIYIKIGVETSWNMAILFFPSRSLIFMIKNRKNRKSEQKTDGILRSQISGKKYIETLEFDVFRICSFRNWRKFDRRSFYKREIFCFEEVSMHFCFSLLDFGRTNWSWITFSLRDIVEEKNQKILPRD